MGRQAVLVLARRLSGGGEDWSFMTLPHAVVARGSAGRLLPRLAVAEG